MNRRHVLKSTAVVASATVLAGCSGVLGGGGSSGDGCGKPSGNLVDALPSGGSYTQQGDVTTESTDKDVTDIAAAAYKGPNGKQHYFGITKFKSAEVANSKISELKPGGDLQLGYIHVDEFVYFSYGASKKSVKALMSEAKPLNSGCVDANVKFV